MLIVRVLLIFSSPLQTGMSVLRIKVETLRSASPNQGWCEGTPFVKLKRIHFLA